MRFLSLPKQIWLVIFILAVVLFIRYIFHSPDTDIRDGEELSFKTRLLDEPSQKGITAQLQVSYTSGEKLFVITTLDNDLHYGDSIEITGLVRERMIDDSRLLYLYFPKITLLPSNGFFSIIFDIRQSLRSEVKKVFPSEYSGLLLGMLFGIKEDLPSNFKQELQDTGVYHLVAASGMNVSLLSGACLVLFAFLLRRQIAILLTIIFIGLYTILSGLEASILRASLMATGALVASLLGRQYYPFLGLVFSALFLLIIEPFLIEDIGFQLSFLATAGILFFGEAERVVTTKLSQSRSFKNVLLSDLKTTLAAQIWTLPILLYHFHNVNLLSPIHNLLILWTVPFIMLFGSIGVICLLVLPFLGTVALYFVFPFLWYVVTIVSTTSSFSLPLTTVSLNSFLIVGYYLMLTSVCLYAYLRKPQ